MDLHKRARRSEPAKRVVGKMKRGHGFSRSRNRESVFKAWHVLFQICFRKVRGLLRYAGRTSKSGIAIVLPARIIAQKRDGEELTPQQITDFVEGYSADEIPDYQMSAFAMAVFLNGLNAEELAVWTDAMMHSGDILNFDLIKKPKVDKHSTGGVGDKVSIPLGPMVAACGVAIPMMSGRGLGHTGGTLDKLESIPGFTTGLNPDRFTSILDQHGLVLAGQSESLVPADRKLYALRDATGTVPSIPLISSSIMSKKLAEDLDGLVLDVKVGNGAFMKDEASARTLAKTMVGIGSAHGTTTVAYLTRMDEPLGYEVGNASEIIESIAVLRGDGPADLTEVTMVLAAEMLVLGGIDDSSEQASRRLSQVIASGDALELFGQVIEAQGGNREVIDDPSLLPTASHRFEVKAPTSGFVRTVNALAVGRAAMSLGAGRETKEDSVDPGVGITLHAKSGDPVEAGAPLATLAFNDHDRVEAALAMLREAWKIGEAPTPQALIIERIDGELGFRPGSADPTRKGDSSK